MIFNLFLLLTIIFLLFLASMIWPPDSPWAPWWRTSDKIAKRVCKLANIKKGDLVIELGSGDAQFLLTAAKNFQAQGIGIEIDPLRVIISRLKIKMNGLSDNLKIIRGNFFDQNLSKADVIFVYLVPKTLDKLLPKFQKELKRGTKIVSYKYEMKIKKKAYDKNAEIFLYVI